MTRAHISVKDSGQRGMSAYLCTPERTYVIINVAFKLVGRKQSKFSFYVVPPAPNTDSYTSMP